MPPRSTADASFSRRQSLLDRRNADFRRISQRLPGSQPYDNIRPINVPARCDGQTLIECVCEMHPHVDESQWRSWFQSGLIRQGDRVVSTEQSVRGGQQYQHHFPDTIEPDVNARIKVLWEDNAIVALHKPAPLPVHPCGRFNRNTLTALLQRVYGPSKLRLVHRLDANTTGVIVMARSAQVATQLRGQFERNEIRKRYQVRCHGCSPDDAFQCDLPISRNRDIAGTRGVVADGDPACTRFVVKQRFDDGTTLVDASPVSGRTNQIRIHLWALGMPVVGDPAYRQGLERCASQTIGVGDPPMCLHAAELSFAHPETGKEIRIAAPEPDWAAGV
tara:strand:- start:64203 stop:65201 length:999 start_codon:yes stop_codon:yes gene_type:complete